MGKNSRSGGKKKGNPKADAHEREEAAARRSAAREKARQMAEAQSRKEQRTKLFVRSAIAVVVVAVLVVVGVLVWRAAQPGMTPSATADGGVTLVQGDELVASPLVDDADIPAGLAKPTADQLTEGAPHVKVVLDFQCPACQAFELTNGELLSRMVDDGAISLEYNAISFLDSTSGGNRYSTRAANASLCVADSQPQTYMDVVMAMFVNQPGEGESGRTDDELFATLEGAGVDLDQPIATSGEGEDPVSVRECISEEVFSGAVGDNTQNQSEQGYNSTPTVLINGERFEQWQEPGSFAAAIIAASEGAAADAAEEAADDEGAAPEGEQAPAEEGSE